MFFAVLTIYCFCHAFLQYFMDRFALASIFALFGFAIFFLPFGIPLFSKERLPYPQKFEKHILSTKNYSTTRSLMDEAFNKLGDEVVLFLVLFYLVSTIINQYGTMKAYTKTVYGVIKSTPECAVIYTKPNSLICTTFDRQERIFDSGYQIFSNDDLKGIKILNEDIGQLKKKPIPTQTPIPTLTPTVTNTPLPSLTPFSTELPIDQ